MAAGAEQARLMGLGRVAGELVHDLANAVAVLNGRAAVALGDARAGRLPTGELERLSDGADELGQMLRDVLEALRGEALSPEAGFDPLAAAERSVRRFLEGAPPCELRLLCSLPMGLVVPGRASFFGRALANLLSNAARYARGQIRLSLALDARDAGEAGAAGAGAAGEAGAAGAAGLPLVVAVEDDGPGLEGSEAERCFRPLEIGVGGNLGLGLSSVAWATGHLGGQARYAGRSVLGGARFELRLPMRLSMRLPGPRAGQWAGATVGERPRADASRAERAEGSGVDAPLAGASRAGRLLAGRRVLLIEDEPAVRHTLVRLLERLGAEASARASLEGTPEALLGTLLGALPDALVLDLRLGGGRSGLAAWQELKAHLPTLAGRVIFVSGLGPGEPEWERAAATGQPVLPKPLDLQALAHAILRVSPDS